MLSKNFIRYLPIYSRFCGGTNINMAKNLIIPFNKIYDYAREGDPKYHQIIHKNNIHSMISTYNSTHAIKLSGLISNNLEDYIDEYYKIAISKNHTILIDAEDYNIQPTIEKYSNYTMNKYNKKKIVFYKTYQMYRKDSLANLTKDLEMFQNKLAIKLVRGAYLNSDKKYGILFDNIMDTHKSYNQAIDILVNTNNNIIFATHNNDSCYRVMEKNNNSNISFAQLLGMNDKLSFMLKKNNYKVSKYVPYGKFNETVPYLVRRLYENYSIMKYL